MDPNANLEEQLRLASKLVEAIDNDRGVDVGDALRLAKLVIALDERLSHGGALPQPWQAFWIHHRQF